MEWFLGFVEWVVTESPLARFRAEMWVSISAVVVSVWTAWQTQKHAGLSVVPAFSAWVSYPEDENRICSIVIANKGFGPAIVDSLGLFYGNEIMRGYMSDKVRSTLRKAFGNEITQFLEVSSEERGHAFGAGSDHELARFKLSDEMVNQGQQAMGERVFPIVYSMAYRDIYGRRWHFLIRNFEAKTWRRNSPAHLWYRLRYWRYLPPILPIRSLRAPWRQVDR